MADAFFRFGTDIEQTRRQIQSGLSAIASDLARARGGNVSMFDGFAKAAEAAAARAMSALGGVAAQMARRQEWGIGGASGPDLQRQYQQLRAQAAAQTTAAGRELGLSRSEIAAANRQVRQAIDGLFKSIADQLAADAKLSRAAFLRGPDKAAIDAARPRVPNDAIRRIAEIEAKKVADRTDAELREARRLRRQEGLAPAKPGEVGQATRITQEFDRRLAADRAEAYQAQRAYTQVLRDEVTRGKHHQQAREQTAKEQERAARELAKEQERAAREQARRTDHERALREDRARRLQQQVLADPSYQRLSGGRAYAGGHVYGPLRDGEGLQRLRGQRADQAMQDYIRALQDRTRQVREDAKQGSLSQAFLGGLTSAGFGSRATGIDMTGLARSFGSTVKFTTQYQALQAIQLAFTDTIKEAVDYRDSLTDLEVAVGDGARVNAAYVDSLSEISRVAGGNVGQALDAAARGVRAFTEAGDTATVKQEAGRQSARLSTQLSVITGQTIPDAMGDLVAVGQSFELSLGQLGQIADAVSAAKQQGGDPMQILQGTANAAVALKAAGFTVADSTQLMSGVIAQLNESGQAAATRLSRIISAAGSPTGRQFFRQLDIDPDQSAKQSLVQLALRYEDLGAAQQQQALRTLGGASNLREFKALIDTIRGSVDGFTNGFDTAGKGQEEFDRKTQNLSGQLKLLAGTISNIQNEVFDSGAFAPFLAALATLQPALSTVEALLKTFNQLKDTITSIPGLDFNIGGVGLGEVAVGIGEIVLISKVYNSLRGKQALDTKALSSLNAQLAASQRVVASATGQETGAAAANIQAHRVAIATIETEILALNALAGARVRAGTAAAGEAAATGASRASRIASYLPFGGAIGRGADRGASAARGVGAMQVLGTTVGRIGLWGAVIVGTTQAALAFKGALDRNTESLKASRDAIDTVGGGGTLTDAAAGLRAAASERDQASSGIFGNLQDAYRKSVAWLQGEGDVFGKDAERDSKVLKDYARGLEEWQKQLNELRKDRQRTGEFDDIFGDVTSIEALKAGLDALNTAGASATRTVELLNTALQDAGKKGAFVAPGGIERVGMEVGRSAVDVAEAAYANAARAAAARAGRPLKIEDVVGTEEYNDNWSMYNQWVRDRIGRDKLGDWQDPKVRAEAERRLAEEYLSEAAGKNVAENFPVKQRAQLLKDAAGELQSYLEQALPEGGFLTPEQVNDAAARMADFLVGKNPALSRDALVTEWRKKLNEKLGQDFTLTVEQQQVLDPASIQLASQQLEQETALTGDPVAAQHVRLSTLRTQIDRDLKSGLTPSDALLAAYADTVKSINSAVQERIDAMDMALRGTTAVGAAGVSVRSARAAVQATTYDTAEFWSAYGEYNKALAELADAQVEESISKRNAAVRPGDRLGRAQAELRNAQDRYNAYKNLKYADPEDFAPGGKYYKQSPFTPKQAGQKTGDDFVDGIKTTNYYGTGKTVGQQLVAGFKAAMVPPKPGEPGFIGPVAPKEPAPLTRWEREGLPDPTKVAAPKPKPTNYPTPETDPQEEARRLEAVTAAREALAEARKQAREDALQRQIAKIQAGVFPGAAIQEASAQVRIARLQLRHYAKGTTEWYNALASLHQAQVQLSQALIDAAKTRFLLANDITNPVHQARAETQAALAKLKADQKAGAPKEVLDADRLAVRQAQAAQEQALFNQRLADVQHNERVGKISHAAYINYLQNEHNRLSAIRNKTRQQIEQLQQIDELLHAANEQMQGQFNLGDIRLPTVYEVRRSIAQSAAGQAQGGASVISSVTVNVNGGDKNSVLSVLGTYLGPGALAQATGTTTTKV